MTCRQKLILDHLDWPINEFDRVLNGECPSHYRYLDDPKKNDSQPLCPYYNCNKCWDREIPGTAGIEDIRRVLNDLL